VIRATSISPSFFIFDRFIESFTAPTCIEPELYNFVERALRVPLGNKPFQFLEAPLRLLNPNAKEV